MFSCSELQGVEIIEKFYGLRCKRKIWIVHTNLWHYRGGIVEERNTWFKIKQLAYILGKKKMSPNPHFHCIDFAH